MEPTLAQSMQSSPGSCRRHSTLSMAAQNSRSSKLTSRSTATRSGSLSRNHPSYKIWKADASSHRRSQRRLSAIWILKDWRIHPDRYNRCSTAARTRRPNGWLLVRPVDRNQVHGFHGGVSFPVSKALKQTTQQPMSAPMSKVQPEPESKPTTQPKSPGIVLPTRAVVVSQPRCLYIYTYVHIYIYTYIHIYIYTYILLLPASQGGSCGT